MSESMENRKRASDADSNDHPTNRKIANSSNPQPLIADLPIGISFLSLWIVDYYVISFQERKTILVVARGQEYYKYAIQVIDSSDELDLIFSTHGNTY